MLKFYCCLFLAGMALSFANAQSDPRFKVVGYINTWDKFPASISAVDLTKITHLNIAFAQVGMDGELTGIEGLPLVVRQAHAHNVKVLISVGGADLNGSGLYWKKWTGQAEVLMFVAKVADYLDRNNLDGIDIDLEGTITADDYARFIKALSVKLRPAHKLVTAAVGTWYAQKIPAACFPFFDFVNVMSYDSTGPWAPSCAGQHAPLSMAQRDIEFWKQKGLPKEKIVLGVPFYGYGFYSAAAGDEIAYKDIVSRYPGAEDRDQTGHTIYYNGIPTIRKKTRLALREASGIMIWQLTSDAKGDRSLLNAVDGVIH